VNANRVRLAFVVVASFAASACSWLTDFRQQPSVGPWQSLKVDWSDTTTPSRGNPQGSVPTTGAVIAPYQVSYARTLAAVDSMSYLRNPEAPTQASVDRGWKYFQVNCAVCHGNGGAGDGLALKFNIPAPSLLTDLTKGRSDGFMFGQMRNGGTYAMPTMNRIDERDRWHVINYVRGLQGKLPAEIVVRKEAPGRPGVTGDSLPGPTRVGPQQSVPFAKPAYVPTPAKAGGRGGQP
jgi:mono/diheme cytochrome c family protein